MIRRQLPAYSPLALSSVAKACVDSICKPQEARDRLTSFLAQRYPCENVVLTGSGTQSLEVAIRMGLGAAKPGTSVGLPAYSCFDVLTAAVGAGAPVLFYDLDPDTLAPDMDSVRGVLARGAGVVVVASLYGFPVDWDAVGGFCADTGAVLIEDAAQGLGSTWRGREGGTFGELTILSFGRGKGWTGGGGGALLLRGGWGRLEEELEVQLAPCRGREGLRAAVLALAQWGLGRPALFGLPSAIPWLALGETVYKEPRPPGSIPPFSAALAGATAVASGAAVASRRRVASELMELVNREGVPAKVRPVRVPEGGESAYLRFPALSSGAGRSLLESRQARTLGIIPGYPCTLPELPAARALGSEQAGPLPGASELSASLFTFPTHALLRRKDIARMAAMLGSTDRQGR